MTFSESSIWIRAYDWCGAFLEFVIRGLDQRRSYDGVDLCSLVRRYVFTALTAVSVTAVAFVFAFLFYSVWTEIVAGFRYHRDVSGLGVIDSLRASGIVTFLQIIGTISGIVGSIVGLVCIGVMWHEHRNPLLRGVSFVLRMIGMGIFMVIAGLVMALYYVFIWPIVRIYQLFRKKGSASRSPSFWKIATRWIHGQLHGICFKIDVVPG